ncbi:hypothetical protein AL705_03415 [Lawsonella clevelandensis]|uniref:Uncharacterized protein n=1 Tax=Lawsonella clevelandensis TaxID=1528099 RepID=A0A0M4MBZ3_9ACTN|nr:hypothetical protein AL705_03415 [Lawsonella clevelandensis]
MGDWILGQLGGQHGWHVERGDDDNGDAGEYKGEFQQVVHRNTNDGEGKDETQRVADEFEGEVGNEAADDTGDDTERGAAHKVQGVVLQCVVSVVAVEVEPCFGIAFEAVLLGELVLGGLGLKLPLGEGDGLGIAAEGSAEGVDGVSEDALQRDGDDGLALAVNDLELVAFFGDLEGAVLEGDAVAVLIGGQTFQGVDGVLELLLCGLLRGGSRVGGIGGGCVGDGGSTGEGDR